MLREVNFISSPYLFHWGLARDFLIFFCQRCLTPSYFYTANVINVFVNFFVSFEISSNFMELHTSYVLIKGLSVIVNAAAICFDLFCETTSSVKFVIAWFSSYVKPLFSKSHLGVLFSKMRLKMSPMDPYVFQMQNCCLNMEIHHKTIKVHSSLVNSIWWQTLT